MVKSKTLLFIAGIVWMIAGFNILRIGLISYAGHIHILNIVCSVAIFFAFWLDGFSKAGDKTYCPNQGLRKRKEIFLEFFRHTGIYHYGIYDHAGYDCFPQFIAGRRDRSFLLRLRECIVWSRNQFYEKLLLLF